MTKLEIASFASSTTNIVEYSTARTGDYGTCRGHRNKSRTTQANWWSQNEAVNVSFQEDLMAEKNERNALDLNDVMKELKSIKTEFGKRFDRVDSMIDEQVEKLKQKLEDVKTDQTESRK